MSKLTAAYENNPFNIGLMGLKLFFDKAKSVAIFAIFLCAISFILNGLSGGYDYSSTTMTEEQAKAQQQADEAAVREFFSQDPGTLAVIGILGASALFLFIVLSLWLYGALEYTGARLAAGERTELKEALKTSGSELASYVWLYVIIFVKVLLWSLLFIIPGIIMAVRYSLAGTSFFAEGKRGNAAVKRSLELTRGAWFTTFGGMALWNIMTLGLISYLLQPGINAVLYRQFVPLTDKNEQKPAPHWLSWATLVAPIALLGLLVMIGVIIAAIFIALAG